jgi:hypothetical protein
MLRRGQGANLGKLRDAKPWGYSAIGTTPARLQIEYLYSLAEYGQIFDFWRGVNSIRRSFVVQFLSNGCILITNLLIAVNSG